MPKRTKDYHAWLIKRLEEPREAERYLKVALEDSPEMFLKALRNVAEARKMAKVAEGAGVNRESLYRTLSEDGNPRYDTLNSILMALDIELTVKLKTSTVSNESPSGMISEIAENKEKPPQFESSAWTTLQNAQVGIVGLGNFAASTKRPRAAMRAFSTKVGMGNSYLQPQMAGGM